MTVAAADLRATGTAPAGAPCTHEPTSPPPLAAGRCRGDDGVATVLVLSLTVLLVVVGGLAVTLAAVAVARQRAASAADLSALAAAQDVLAGPDAACASAASLAQRVDARLSACEVDGDVVSVVVEVRPPGPVGRLGAASARARAGPVATAGVIGRAVEPEGRAAGALGRALGPPGLWVRPPGLGAEGGGWSPGVARSGRLRD